MSDAVELPPEESAANASRASLWYLIFFTPLSELLRGKLTGPMGKAGRSVAVLPDLPAPLLALIRDVTKRTRLWRSERAEITRELFAHFADGLDSGRSAEQLINDFGDPAGAARLLRRAAKRNRPWAWRAMRMAMRAMGIVLLAIVTVYASLALNFYLGRPGPIIDYRPQLNAATLKLKDEDKAWPLYREALLRLPMSGPESALVGEGTLNRMPHPGEEGWDVVQDYLQECAPAFESARRASDKPGLGLSVGYSWTPADQALWGDDSRQDEAAFISPEGAGIVGILLPQLGALRRLAVALALDVERAAAASDGSAAVADLCAMLAISRHVRETPTLINDLVSIAVLNMTTDRLNRALAQSPASFSDGQLLILAHRLAAFDDAAIAINLRGERLMTRDVLQRIYTDDGTGDGHITSSGLRRLGELSNGWDKGVAVKFTGPALSAIVLGRRAMTDECNRYFDKLEAESRLPLWEREESSVETEVEQWMASPIQRLRHLPLCTMLPTMSKAIINAELAMMRRDAALTVIALELYRRRHGTWPASLQDLVPSMLPALPMDRFDGDPLRYVVKDGKPLVYSVGTDREDDGGVLPAVAAVNSPQWYAQHWVPRLMLEQGVTTNRPDGTRGPVYDGDWILWPPLPESPLRIEQ